MATNRDPGVTAIAYTVAEAAQSLHISRDGIYELIRSGRLRTVMLGRRRLVPVSALHAFIAAELGDL